LRGAQLTLTVLVAADAWPAELTDPQHQARAAADKSAGPGSLSDTRRHLRHVLVSAVIPARNEARNIAWVLGRIPDVVDEVVVVDGQSHDLTVEVARMVRPDVVVVSDRGRGKGDAMRIGIETARGDVIIMIDADGSMDPAEIERFLSPLAGGYDLVKGSRFMKQGGTADMTPLRKVGHAVLLGLTNILYKRRWSDLCYGFCAFRRHALERLALDADGFEIETQMVTRAARLGFRITEVPSYEFPRRSGTSQLNTFRDGWRVLQTIFKERVRVVALPHGAHEEPVRVKDMVRDV